jgi:hypothetical protein
LIGRFGCDFGDSGCSLLEITKKDGSSHGTLSEGRTRQPVGVEELKRWILQRVADWQQSPDLALGAIGMYSVMSFHFAERKAEIAMRLALGAERRHILRLILRRSLGLVAIGGLIGSAVVLGATNSLVSLIPGTQRLEAHTFAMSLAAFLSIGLVAALVPALRAAREDRSLPSRFC